MTADIGVCPRWATQLREAPLRIHRFLDHLKESGHSDGTITHYRASAYHFAVGSGHRHRPGSSGIAPGYRGWD